MRSPFAALKLAPREPVTLPRRSASAVLVHDAPLQRKIGIYQVFE